MPKKITTQVVTPEWAKGEMLEITVDGGRPMWIGAYKCSVFAACAAQIAEFGATYEKPAPKTQKAAKATASAVGKAKLVAGTLVNTAAPTAMPADVVAMFENMQKQIAQLTAAKTPAAAKAKGGVKV